MGVMALKLGLRSKWGEEPSRRRNVGAKAEGGRAYSGRG